jgi:hypothetical protein
MASSTPVTRSDTLARDSSIASNFACCAAFCSFNFFGAPVILLKIRVAVKVTTTVTAVEITRAQICSIFIVTSSSSDYSINIKLNSSVA